MNSIKKHVVTLAGVAVMAIALAMSTFMVDERVPNDSNIGAGILFLAGIAIVIAGVAMAWSRRSSLTPPPPTATN